MIPMICSSHLLPCVSSYHSQPKDITAASFPLGLCRQVLTSKALRAIRGNILRSAQLSLTSFWELSSVEGI